MGERFYRDFSGENGTIIRDKVYNDEDVYEYGLDDSKTLCELLNQLDNENKKLREENNILIRNNEKLSKDVFYLRGLMKRL